MVPENFINNLVIKILFINKIIVNLHEVIQDLRVFCEVVILSREMLVLVNFRDRHIVVVLNQSINCNLVENFVFYYLLILIKQI